MQEIILILHMLTCLAIIGLVLIQHGKGADLGASFGSGASNTVFGSQGSGSFLARLTATLAAVFFATSLTLGYLASHQYHQAQNTNVAVPTPASIPADSVSGSGTKTKK